MLACLLVWVISSPLTPLLGYKWKLVHLPFLSSILVSEPIFCCIPFSFWSRYGFSLTTLLSVGRSLIVRLRRCLLGSRVTCRKTASEDRILWPTKMKKSGKMHGCCYFQLDVCLALFWALHISWLILPSQHRCCSHWEVSNLSTVTAHKQRPHVSFGCTNLTFPCALGSLSAKLFSLQLWEE